MKVFSWQLTQETSGVSMTVSRRLSDQHTARLVHFNRLLVKPSQARASKWRSEWSISWTFMAGKTPSQMPQWKLWSALPVFEELDQTLSLEVLSQAIDSLPTGKAPGLVGIPAEATKSAKEPLLEHLHTLLCQCWEEGDVPQDMQDCNIISLYKNKGDCCDCNNYRGISLLSTIRKVFTCLVLNRLKKLADVYIQSQCGFRLECSMIDMRFSL